MASIECMHAGPFIFLVFYIFFSRFLRVKGEDIHTRHDYAYCIQHTVTIKICSRFIFSQEREGDTVSNLVLVSLMEVLKILSCFYFFEYQMFLLIL